MSTIEITRSGTRNARHLGIRFRGSRFPRWKNGLKGAGCSTSRSGVDVSAGSLYLSKDRERVGLFNLVHEACTRWSGVYVSAPRRLACPLIRYCPPPTPTPHWRNAPSFVPRFSSMQNTTFPRIASSMRRCFIRTSTLKNRKHRRRTTVFPY